MCNYYQKRFTCNHLSRIYITMCPLYRTNHSTCANAPTDPDPTPSHFPCYDCIRSEWWREQLQLAAANKTATVNANTHPAILSNGAGTTTNLATLPLLPSHAISSISSAQPTPNHPPHPPSAQKTPSEKTRQETIRREAAARAAAERLADEKKQQEEKAEQERIRREGGKWEDAPGSGRKRVKGRRNVLGLGVRTEGLGMGGPGGSGIVILQNTGRGGVGGKGEGGGVGGIALGKTVLAPTTAGEVEKVEGSGKSGVVGGGSNCGGSVASGPTTGGLSSPPASAENTPPLDLGGRAGVWASKPKSAGGSFGGRGRRH
ncbi:hypothetical protein P154DRAFT_589097 [Amniculicola lignicola CBS 123094]|uniref:Uncharacterized protein n=1 Tax=Amniculicola lignicola CBS 123094 TaxID=1392246 RepID=A0A6A5VXU5_9PLEO|nr:hypothetical protein P154DRAFT_589097 [Amniculicola lignicola CBS 123094]